MNSRTYSAASLMAFGLALGVLFMGAVEIYYKHKEGKAYRSPYSVTR